MEIVRIIRQERGPVQINRSTSVVRVSQSTATVRIVRNGVPITINNYGNSEPGRIGLTSTGSFSSGRLLATVGGVLTYYNPANLAHKYALSGLTVTAANSGEPLTLQASAGEVTVPGWGLTPDAIYYAGPAGSITNVPPTTGILQAIGRAVDADTLLYSPQSIFIL